MKNEIMQTQASKAMPAALFENLHRQLDLSGQLLEILDQELAALTGMEIQGLLNLARKKESQLKRLQLLDAAFQEIGRNITGNPAPEPIRLRELIKLASREEAARLEQSRLSLVALRHKIHDRNLINKQLAQDVLGYLNDAVSLITTTAAGQVPYSAKGLSRPSLRQPTLISREI